MSRSRSSAAAAPARRPSVAPRHPRRVSGPVRPIAVPGRPRASAPAVAAPQTFGARVRALGDHRWLDTLLRSRAWIWLLGIGLGGIVFMQVSLLDMNAGIGRSVAKSSALQGSNAALEEQVAALSSGDRVRAAAEGLGLISPDAGQVGYLGVRGRRLDARRAAGTMTAPSDAAQQNVATDGASGTEAPATTTEAPVPAATPVATATAVAPAVTPAATAAPVVTPAATAAPPPQSGALPPSYTTPGQ